LGKEGWKGKGRMARERKASVKEEAREEASKDQVSITEHFWFV
jgi:hypothetical protein